MLKMTAKEIAQQKKLEAELRAAHDVVQKAISDFCDKVDDTKEFLSALYGRIEDEVSVRSEKWRESDSASRVTEWMEEIATADPESIAIPDIDAVAASFISLSTAPMED